MPKVQDMDISETTQFFRIFPESMPRRRNATIERNLSSVHSGMVPENLFSPRSSDNMCEQFSRDEERSLERLLLLNCNHIRLGSEHIESGMPPDGLFLERSKAYRFCIPFQWSWISPEK